MFFVWATHIIVLDSKVTLQSTSKALYIYRASKYFVYCSFRKKNLEEKLFGKIVLQISVLYLKN